MGKSMKVMKQAMKAKSRAMKSMKAMKAMKAMKVSKIAKGARMRAAVYSGSKEKTSTGLKKSDLMKSKSGKIITKKSHAAEKKAYKNIKAWVEATKKVRKAMGLKGFVAIKKGTAFYKAVKAELGA